MMLRHLIVVVPGMAGSVLADGDGVVWGDTARRVVSIVRDPGRLSTDAAPTLRAVGLMPTLGFCPPFQLPGYDRLVNGLVNRLGPGTPVVDVAVDGRGRNLAADIVVLPYDFRLGVEAASQRLAAEVHARLGHLSTRERAGRVIVIGHSMGGLVGRHWLADPDEAARCMALLTIGTPHRGATKALDWLVNGASIGGAMRVGSRPAVVASRQLLSGLTDVLRGWPGMYDLLPTYRVVDDRDGDRQVAPVDLAGPDGPGFAADPAFRRESERALTMHERITAAWAAPAETPRPPTVPFFGRDHGTAHLATVDSGVLTAAATDPLWQPNPGWHGDGTVPALSAIPPELGRPADGDRRHHVLDRHVPMAGTEAVVQMVRDLIGEDMSAVRGTVGPPSRIRLGVDLDDGCLLGDTTTVTARLLTEGDVLPDGVTVWLTAEREDRPGSPLRQRAERVGDAWVSEFVPPTAGLWRLTVQAVRAEGDEPPAITDTLGVLDPEEPDLGRSGMAFRAGSR